MTTMELYFVGPDERTALRRGPITSLDVARMIASEPDVELHVYKADATVKTWELEPVE